MRSASTRNKIVSPENCLDDLPITCNCIQSGCRCLRPAARLRNHSDLAPQAATKKIAAMEERIKNLEKRIDDQNSKFDQKFEEIMKLMQEIRATLTTSLCIRSETISQPSDLDSAKMFDLEVVHQVLDKSESKPVTIAQAVEYAKLQKENLITSNEESNSVSEATGSLCQGILEFIDKVTTMPPVSLFYSQKTLAKMGFETFQSPLEVSINQLGKISNESLLGSNLYNGIKKKFGYQTSFARIDQYVHILFDVMLERDAKKIFERTVFIFDPGGEIFDAKYFFSICSISLTSFSDFSLEDKAVKGREL